MENHAAGTDKTAIVVASFGTTYPSAVNALQAIVQDIRTAYPHTTVQMAFTSHIIRKKWHNRATDADYRKSHPQIPEYFYRIKNILGTLADLRDQGYKTIVVQPTHLTHGEEFLALTAQIEDLRSIKTTREDRQPFNKIALGRPLMGSWQPTSPDTDDLARLARAVAEDVEAAQQANAALVYMGHGNAHLSTGIYDEFELRMNRHYPQIKTIIGLIEGHPNLDEVLTKLQQTNSKKVLLKPLMIVAGDHAANDMAGTEENSWKTLLQVAGFRVSPILQGLGDNAAVRRMFIDHLQDAATEAGIELR